MPTNDERREVARRLRDNAGQKPGWVIPWAAFNDAYEHEGAELLNRLASLIEPEELTCRLTILTSINIGSSPIVVYVCSECQRAITYDRYCPMHFCPNCGAKVVGE